MHNKKTRCKDMSIDTSKTLVTKNKGRSKSKGLKRHSKSKGRSQSRVKFNCYHYGKKTYIKRNCKDFKKEHKNEKN